MSAQDLAEKRKKLGEIIGDDVVAGFSDDTIKAADDAGIITGRKAKSSTKVNDSTGKNVPPIVQAAHDKVNRTKAEVEKAKAAMDELSEKLNDAELFGTKEEIAAIEKQLQSARSLHIQRNEEYSAAQEELKVIEQNNK